MRCHFRHNPSLFFLFLSISLLTIFAQAQQPPTCTPPPSGMAAWWRGDGSATDVVGGHDGSLVGGASFTPTSCAPGTAGCGMVGQAFSLDGTSGYVLIPNNAALQPPDAISIDAWVYPTSFTGGRMIISKYNTYVPCCNGVSWSLGVRESGQVDWEVIDARYGPGSDIYVDVLTDVPLILNAWSHVAATFDTATQEIAVYINGQKVPTSCAPGSVCSPVTSIEQSPSDVMIGAATFNSLPRPGLGAFWSGQIDEVELHNRALSPTEIQNIFNAGSAGKCRAATFSSTLTDISNARQLGLIDNNGIANSLSQKIHAAQKATVPARNNILNAFKNEVTAQAGKHVTGVAVQMLLQDVNSLLSQN
jgi:Concanavalin A-like lectin/glucanases superfamily